MRGRKLTEPVIKADLIPFNDANADLVRAWIDSEQAYLSVCRGRDWPPPDDIIKQWQRDDMSGWLLIAGGEPVGYGEIWERPHDLAVELNHLLVDPAKRRSGYGRRLIELLFERAASRKDVAKVMANLYAQNTGLLDLFMSAGFLVSSTAAYVEGLKLIRTVNAKSKS
jgi:GNAT superfamily N-acetyltransferase